MICPRAGTRSLVGTRTRSGHVKGATWVYGVGRTACLQHANRAHMVSTVSNGSWILGDLDVYTNFTQFGRTRLTPNGPDKDLGS